MYHKADRFHNEANDGNSIARVEFARPKLNGRSRESDSHFPAGRADDHNSVSALVPLPTTSAPIGAGSSTVGASTCRYLLEVPRPIQGEWIRLPTAGWPVFADRYPRSVGSTRYNPLTAGQIVFLIPAGYTPAHMQFFTAARHPGILQVS